jgi:hypothetical protein
VTRFARRFRVDGLPAKLAAQTAARELAQEAICGFLGIPEPRYTGRFRAPVAKAARPTRKIAPRAQSGATAKVSGAGRDADRLARLKKFIDTPGPGPRGGRKKAT